MLVRHKLSNQCLHQVRFALIVAADHRTTCLHNLSVLYATSFGVYMIQLLDNGEVLCWGLNSSGQL
jgi:Regulator of chromosome condensation (RCC1) repeat